MTSAATPDTMTNGVSKGGRQLQLVTFEVGGEEYAVDILAVQEINRMMDLTRVPQSPAEVEGVINLRGKIIPVIDLRKRFGLQVSERTPLRGRNGPSGDANAGRVRNDCGGPKAPARMRRKSLRSFGDRPARQPRFFSAKSRRSYGVPR